MTRGLVVLSAALLTVLSGCGEKVQTTASGGGKKADTPGWQQSNSAYLAPGWTPGDRTSWEAHLRTRAQGQNDFAVPN